MYILGVDVAKDSLVCVVINRSDKVKQSSTIANTKKEIGKLLKQLTSKYKHLTVASEATSEYHRLLVKECLKCGLTFRLLNPITTKQFTRATVRKKKTDLSDAQIIAKLTQIRQQLW